MSGEAKSPQFCDKVFWKRAVDFNHAITNRVLVGQKAAVQQEPPSCHCRFVMITAVTNYRPASLEQLLTDLVSPTGDQLEFKERRPTVVVDWPEPGQCGFHAPLCEDWSGQLSCLDDDTLYQRQVSFVHPSSHQHLPQLASGLFAFAKQYGSGCACIKPVDRCQLKYLPALVQENL